MTTDELREKYGIGWGEPLSWVTCSNCDDSIPCFSNKDLPENGLSIDLNSVGHYGGFTDILTETIPFFLCHDCVVRMLSALPVLSKKLGNGHHSCALDKPCCDFAFRFDDTNGVQVPKNGEWVVQGAWNV